MSYLLIGLIGYLVGSISFARIVVRIFSPAGSVNKIEVNVPGSEVDYQSDAVSATAVNLQLGPRYGCLTSLLDMAKVGLPALAFKLLYPESNYHLIFAAFGTLGHIWPIYFRFKGGRGMSPILASFAVVDWLGVLVSFGVSLLVGMIRKDFYIGNKLSILLMIPWLWFRTGDLTLLLFAIALNLMNIIAVLPEFRQIRRLRAEENLDDFLHAERLQVTSQDGTDPTYRYTFYGEYQQLIRRIKGWLGKGSAD